MNCLKCGRKIENSGVFCDSCLDTMAKYPVKSNTPLQLPRRKEEPGSRKTAKKKYQSRLEEQFLNQKRQIRRLTVLICVLMLVLCLTVGWLVFEVVNNHKPADNIGKNYNTSEPG